MAMLPEVAAQIFASQDDARWPTESNTGPTDRNVLAEYHGTYQVTGDQIVTDLHIFGKLRFVGPGSPVLRNVIVTATGGGYLSQHASNVHPWFDHVEFDGASTASQLLMAGGSYHMTACSWHHGGDGPRITTGTTAVDCYGHHIVRAGSLHGDCLQVTGSRDWLIQHCRLEAWNPDSGDLNNSAIMVGDNTGDTLRGRIIGNLMSGGNSTVNLDGGTGRSEVLCQDNAFIDKSWRQAPGNYTAILHGPSDAPQLDVNNVIWTPPASPPAPAPTRHNNAH